jgi:hypothetical protein
MEKMDQTHTDCNLTRMGFPGETPVLTGDICLFLSVFSGYHPSEKTPHSLFPGMRGC